MIAFDHKFIFSDNLQSKVAAKYLLRFKITPPSIQNLWLNNQTNLKEQLSFLGGAPVQKICEVRQAPGTTPSLHGCNFVILIFKLGDNIWYLASCGEMNSLPLSIISSPYNQANCRYLEREKDLPGSTEKKTKKPNKRSLLSCYVYVCLILQISVEYITFSSTLTNITRR